MIMAQKLETMTVDDMCEWIKGQDDIPDTMESVFRDEGLDGTAVSIGLSTSPGPDWLKDVIAKVGVRLKVHHGLKTLYNQCQAACSSVEMPSPSHGSGSVANSYAGSTDESIKTPTLKIVESHNETPVRLMKKRSIAKRDSTCPDPFPIPKFRVDTESNFAKNILTDSDRKYVVQTMATMLMTYIPQPSLGNCGIVAQSLIDKFEFLKDGVGDGEHSWKWFIYYRCQNINRPCKSDDSSTLPKKQLKMDNWAAHLYPPINADDDESFKKNSDLLSVELGKSKPRPDVLKSLMARTFSNRFQELSNGVILRDYITKYPLLTKSAYASQEFAMIVKVENIRDIFEENFPKWAKAILCYCKDTQIKATAIQQECSKYTDSLDEEHSGLIAMRCLSLLLVPAKKKTIVNDDIPYIMKIVPRGTPLTEATFKANNQPHIVMLRTEEESESFHQYFISVEQRLILECSTFISSVYFCMVAHYIFNLSYHSKTKEFWSFIQEKVFMLPSTQTKHTPSVTSHFAGIVRVFQGLMGKDNM